jgi:hypothetical protein
LNHLLLRLISTLLKLEISTLLKTITNSCFQALEGLKFQSLEGLKFQDKQTQKQMIQTKVFKKSKISQIYYCDPQFAGINLQSPQSDSTPWTLTLVSSLGMILGHKFIYTINVS